MLVEIGNVEVNNIIIYKNNIFIKFGIVTMVLIVNNN